MDMWKAKSDVYEAMKGLIEKHHPDLLDVQDKILILFKEKASVKGGVTTIGNTKKAPPLLSKGIVTEKNKKYTYIIELGGDAWNMLSDRDKTAQLDHCLCAMDVSYDKEGYPKYGIKPPDFEAYRGEVARWGLWHPQCNEDAENLVDKMFGPEKHGEAHDDEDALSLPDFG